MEITVRQLPNFGVLEVKLNKATQKNGLKFRYFLH